MSARAKKLYVDDEIFAAVAGFRTEAEALGRKMTLGEVTCELISEGLRTKRADMWDAPFARGVRNAMLEVAEADRLSRLEDVGLAVGALEGRALEVKAAAFALLLGLGFGTEEIAALFEEGLRLALEESD